MSPSVAPDNFSDLTPASKTASNDSTMARTLILAPPSISSHPEVLNRVFETHNRSVTDMQMLDRLALGLISLPSSTYELILVLADPDGTYTESTRFLGRDVLPKLLSALKDGGVLQNQTGAFGADNNAQKTEAILAGFVSGDKGMVKPEAAEEQVVPLRFGKKAKATENGTSNGATNGSLSASVPLNGKRKIDSANPAPVGVGFVDFSDDFGEPLITGEDDELIDEDDLLTEEDRLGPLQIPEECKPKVGKRRRACKDCTCGLKERIEADDSAKRAEADKSLNAMKLDVNDLAEIDFTVQGKVGSCGNCSLGDAFRCDGCPYTGLPAFKPGEEVLLLNNDVQL